MWSPLVVLASSLVLPALCQNSSNSSVPTGVYPFSIYTLSAENITAKLIPYGARLTSLLVQDRNGTYQDVVVGYDNATQYLTDTESESYCIFESLIVELTVIQQTTPILDPS